MEWHKIAVSTIIIYYILYNKALGKCQLFTAADGEPIRQANKT